MANNNNMVHVSPGIYARDMVDMSSVTNSTGITKLAVVGETLKGPAFQPYWVHSQGEYASIFGGTSTEKYKYTQYPRYELPYIANEFLTQGSDLCVVRTLGLSGYNAGPAWVITGEKSTDENSEKYVIAVLRARGNYQYNTKFSDLTDETGCTCKRAYDSLIFETGELKTISSCSAPLKYNMSAVQLDYYKSIGFAGGDCDEYALSGDTDAGFDASYGDLGRFTIKCILGVSEDGEKPGQDSNTEYVSFPVSFNKTDKEYILNVLGTSNDDGNAPIYVESLFDTAWENLVKNEGYDTITSGLTVYNVADYADYCGLEDVDGILTKPESELKKNDVGKRYLYSKRSPYHSPDDVSYYVFGYANNTPIIYDNDFYTAECEECYIYTVKSIKNKKGNIKYVYTSYNKIETDEIINFNEKIRAQDHLLMLTQTQSTNRHGMIVYNKEDGFYYKNLGSGSGAQPITCDLNDYKSAYRYSSTPWIVSNTKGDANNVEVNRLFRFHTISDGDASRYEVKVSIENIKPDTGEFDVVVRDYFDNDYSVNALERFTKCTLTSGENSIAYKIGTIDGSYEGKSKYITVELNENQAPYNSVPSGFLGYPIPNYKGRTVTASGEDVETCPITYNLKYNENISKRKQYFGLSEITGYDIDYFTFKGNMATIEEPGFMTHGFHLDCRMDTKSYSGSTPNILVDGVEGYIFDSVDVNSRTLEYGQNPIIGTEEQMLGSIYEDVRLRKFTVMFEGGFDGWDKYRKERSNRDEFAITNYKGYINKASGIGYGIDRMKNPSMYGIEEQALTSDFYSTLAAVSLLKNPEENDINLLATPGIDTINNTKLINEIFNILDERADTFYIVTSPDKQRGMPDYVDYMYDPDEFASTFDSKDLYSDNAATYYPWIKIEDNGEYIWLPPTRDIVRNIAESDANNTTMNLAPAGTTRGRIDAIRAKKNLTTKECDALYSQRINPIRTYQQNGLIVMGQKTLRKDEDLMSRVDVRRMVLRLRKLIAIGCMGLIFEPYDNKVAKDFKTIISGIMQTFIANRAIEKWTMNVDDSKDAKDKLELNATIYLKPIRAVEYISISFVVTNNEVYFLE